MSTLEKLKQMGDNEILGLYHGFLGFLASEIKYDAIDVIENLPADINSDESVKLIKQAELDKLDSLIKPNEVVPLARIITEHWANDPEISVLLEEYMKTHQLHTMDAGIILAIGSVLVSTIVASSLKVKFKDGKLSIDYRSENISSNAVEMVKTVLTKIPESFKELFTNKK